MNNPTKIKPQVNNSITRIKDQVAEVGRFKSDISQHEEIIKSPGWKWGIHYVNEQKVRLQTTIKIFKAESKNIITRATDELSFLGEDIFHKDCGLQILSKGLSTQIVMNSYNEYAHKIWNYEETIEIIKKRGIELRLEVDKWKTHLEWLGKQ